MAAFCTSLQTYFLKNEAKLIILLVKQTLFYSQPYECRRIMDIQLCQ